MPSALDLLSAAALLDQPTHDSIVAAAAAAAAPASPTVNNNNNDAAAAAAAGLFAQAQEQLHHVPASVVAAAQAHQLGDIARAVINSGSVANQGQGRQRVPSSTGSTGLFAQVLPAPPPPPPVPVSLPPLPPAPAGLSQQQQQQTQTHSHGTRRQAREQQQQQQQRRLHFYTAADGTAQLASPATPAAVTGLPPLPALPLPSTLPPLPSLPRSTASISPLPTYGGVIPAQQQQQPPPAAARKPPPPPYAVPAESGLIRCVCPYTVDDGFTIQCDLCNVWQHAACVGIPSLTDVPDEYCCERCDPVGARERGVDGRLAEVGMRVRMREMERVQEQIKRAEALQAQHHKDWLEREAAVAAAAREQDAAAAAAGGAAGHQHRAMMSEKARSHASAAAAAAVDDDPDFTLHGSTTTPRSRPRATKPRRSGGAGGGTTTSGVTAAASALAGVTSSPQQTATSTTTMTTTTTAKSSREEPAAPSPFRMEDVTETTAGTELPKQKHEESDVEMAADSLPDSAAADQQQHFVSTLAAAAAAETVHAPTPAPASASIVVRPAAALPTLPPAPATAAVPTKTPVPIGRKRRVAKQPKHRASSAAAGSGGGGDGVDDGAAGVPLPASSVPTEPSDGGARLSSLRERHRAAKNASASASAYDDSGLSSSEDERTGSTMTTTAGGGGAATTTSSSRGGDRQARNATVDDEDRYDSWQYEFTPIDSNLYPDVALLDHLEQVLSKPPVSPLDEIDGAQHPNWQGLRERQDATRGMASGRTSAKLVEAVYDLQPAYVELPALPPPAPIVVKPLPLSATNIAQPPVQAAYIPTPYSASLHASSAAAQAMCPYPRPKSFALFATAPIAAGSYITDFKGEIVDLAQYRSDPINQYPLVGAPKGAVRALPHPWSLVIDARRWGNEARFARSGCKPNAILRVVKVDGNATTATTATAQAQIQVQKRRGKRAGSPKARSRSTTPFPGGGGTGEANSGHGTAQWSAQRLEHPVAGTFHVAIFALTDIHKRDEIILPWDWDDAHLVHLLPSLLALPSPSASPSLLQSLANHLDAAANLSRSMALVADALLAPASSSLNGGCACDRKRDCAVWWLARGGAASCFSLTAKGGGGRATDDVGIAFLNAFAGANGRDKEGIDPSVAKRKAGGGGSNARQVDLGALVGLERGWLSHEPEKVREAAAELATEDGVESETDEVIAGDPDAMSIDPKPAAAVHLQVTPSAGVAISPSSALTSLPSDGAPVLEVAAKAARPPKEVVPSATDAAHDSDSSELTEPLSNLSALEDDDDDDDLSEPDDSVLSPPLPSKVKELSRDVSPQPLPPPKKRKPAAKKPSSRGGKSSSAPSSKEEAPTKASSPAPSKPKQDKAKKEAKDSKKRKVARVYSSSESDSEPVSQDSSRAASRALSPARESSEDTRKSGTPAVQPPASGNQANRPKKRAASSTPGGLAALKIRKVKKHSRRIDSDESEEETRTAKSPLVELAQKTDVGADDVKMMNSDEAVTQSAASSSAATADTVPDATMTSIDETAKSESPAAQPVDQPAQPPPVRARLSFAEYRQRQMKTPGRPMPPPPPPPPPPVPQPPSVASAGVSVASSVEAKAAAPAPAPVPPPPPPPPPPAQQQTPVAHPLAGVTAAQLEALAGALAAASSSPSFTPTMSLTSLSGPSPSQSALSLGLASETPPIRPSVFLRPPPPRPPPPPPPPPPASAFGEGKLGTSADSSSIQASGAGAVPGGDGDEPEAGTPPLPPVRGLAPPPPEPQPAAETPESGKLSAADILKSIGDYFGSASATPSSAKPVRQLAPDALAAASSPSAVSQGTPPLPPPRTPFPGATVAAELPAAWSESSSTAPRGPAAQNRRSSISQTGSALGLHSTSLPSFSSSAAAVSTMQPPSGPRSSGPSPLPGFRPISSQSPVSGSGFVPTYPRASQSPYGKPALLQKSPAGAFSRAPLPSVTPARQASVSPAMASNMALYAGGPVRPSPPVRPVELGGSIPTGPKAMQTGLVPTANAGRPPNAGTASPATPTTPAQHLPSRGGWGPAGRGRGGGGFGGGPPSGPRHPGSGPPPRGRGGWGWRGRGGGRG